jgi:hypothetical protein
MGAGAVHEEDAGNGIRINDMVSAPAAGIVFKQALRKAAQRGGPGNAIAMVEINQQIRSGCGKRS